MALADTALEFHATSSEALYVKALVDLKSQDSTFRGIAEVRQAIAAHEWSETSPEAASQVLAASLVRTGAFQESLDLLQRLVVTEPQDVLDFELQVRALDGLGRLPEAARAAETLVARFPSDPHGYLLSAAIDAERGNWAAALTVVATGLFQLADNPALLLEAATLEADPQRRLAAVAAYSAKGGKDPLAAVLALESSPKDPVTYLNLFLQNDGLSHVELVGRAANAVAGSAAADQFRSALAAFTGIRDLNRDDEGFYEERWQYQAGKPVKWIRDANRGGLPDFTVDFSAGNPVDVTVPLAGAGDMTLRYKAYPFVDSVTETGAQGATEYDLNPDEVGCPLLADAKPSPVVPTKAQILSAAYLEQDIVVSGLIVRRIELAQGKSTYMEEDANRDGIMEHRVWFENGLPVRGVRDFATPGDARITEEYQAGMLSGITVDADGDGKTDYAEQYGAATVKLWDYNEDGTWDAKEFGSPDGSTVREFSTKLDGTFDLRVTFKAGKIASVQERGITLPVVPGQDKGTEWIGTPVSGVHVAPDAPDGFITVGGRTFLVFRFADTTYVEAVP